MSHYSSFVVKLWVDDSQGLTRGYIQHVSTQESVHFTDLDRMTAFIMNHLNPPVSDLPETCPDTAATKNGTRRHE